MSVMIRPFGGGSDAVVGKPRLAEVDGGAAGREPIEVGEFVLGRGEADVEAFGPRRPALFVGFCDAGDQVVVDPGQSQPLSRVNAGQRAAAGI